MKLFETLKIEEEYSNSLTELNVSNADSDFSEIIEEQWLNYLPSHYLPILITDDSYGDVNYSLFAGLRKVKWSMVLEIGNKKAPYDFSTAVAKRCAEDQRIEYCNLSTDDETRISYIPNACLWLQAKKGDDTYLTLWRKHKKILKRIMNQMHERYGLRSFLFLIDVKEGSKFVWSYILDLMDQEEQISGARIVELRKTTADRETLDELLKMDVKYSVIEGSNLINVAGIVDKEIPEDYLNKQNKGIYLPSIQDQEFILVSSEEARFYETSVEILYRGMENNSGSWDYGEGFYKGKEISWNDLANKCDVTLLPDYKIYLNKLERIVEEESPRIKIQKIIHDPGAGGTTLSKRLLWDLKERIPCVILKRYSPETKNVLLAIYRKTRKRVLVLDNMK